MNPPPWAKATGARYGARNSGGFNHSLWTLDAPTERPDRRATGRVIDEFDRPVAGAKAVLEPVSNPGGAAGLDLTAADGSFEMKVEVSRVGLRITLFEGLPEGSNPNRYCDGEQEPFPIMFDDVDIDLGTCRIKRGN